MMISNSKFDKLLDTAMHAHEIKDYDNAFTIYEQLAQDKVCPDEVRMDAMQMLAYMSGHGEAVEMDFEKSIYWDKQAIDLGSIISTSNIAITYRMMGEIIEAKKWFEIAIDKGDIEACLPLAKLYMVSDKETKMVKELLNRIITAHENSDFDSQHVSISGVEEAEDILASL